MNPLKKHYFHSLNGLRGLAFLMVVFAHIGQQSKMYYIAGKVGVVVFFILSSFLIIYPLLKNSDSYSTVLSWYKFARKRLTRIYPMYIFVLFLELSFGGFAISKIVKHFFLLEADKHYWTIPVEMTFYILTPFLALFFVRFLKKKPLYILSCLLLFLIGYGIFYEQIVLLFRTWKTNEPIFILYSTPFVFGITLAVLQNIPSIVRRITTISAKKITLLLSIVWFFVLATIPYSFNAIIRANYGQGFFNIFLWYSILFSVIIFLTINSKTVFTVILESRFFRHMGLISYSGYLMHGLILDLVFHFQLPFLAFVLLSLLMTIILSSLTYTFIEKPILKTLS